MPFKPLLLIAKRFHAESLDYIQQELSSYYNIIIPDSYAEHSLFNHIKNVDAVLGHNIPEPLLYHAENLKYFQCVSSGLDHLNLDIFRKLNIDVGNSTSHAPHVAKFALALMLNIAFKISLNDTMLREKSKNLSGSSTYSERMSPCFFGESVGLVGYGAINKCIQKLLIPFDLNFFYYRKCQDSSSSSLESIFSLCKYIFIALPLNDQTKHVVNEELLIDNPISPYIVNVGRAEVIDRLALIKALEMNSISGFASDLAYGQDSSSPIGFDGLYDFPNVVLSPHRAASTFGIPSYLPGAVAKLVQVSNSYFRQ